jgi:membrane protein implicated in regulation of membrane protease activity
MNRKKAFIRMAWIEGIGLLIPIIVVLIELNSFPYDLTTVLIAVFVYCIILVRYIRKMAKDINNRYPKEEDSL